MTGDDLPDGDHVVRYAKPSFVHPDGSIGVGAFRLRQDEGGLSVRWLEGFDATGARLPAWPRCGAAPD